MLNIARHATLFVSNHGPIIGSNFRPKEICTNAAEASTYAIEAMYMFERVCRYSTLFRTIKTIQLILIKHGPDSRWNHARAYDCSMPRH